MTGPLDPDVPIIRPGRWAEETSVMFPAAESASFSRHGQRTDSTHCLYVGRYSNLHGHQFSKIRFSDLASELRIYSHRERLLLHNRHTYHRHGLRALRIHAGIGEVSPTPLVGDEHITRPWPHPVTVQWVDITHLTSPWTTILQLSAPDNDPMNYGYFSGGGSVMAPRLEFTIPDPPEQVAQMLRGWAK